MSFVYAFCRRPQNVVNVLFYLNILIRHYLIYNNTMIDIEQQRYSSVMLEGGGPFFHENKLFFNRYLNTLLIQIFVSQF